MGFYLAAVKGVDYLGLALEGGGGDAIAGIGFEDVEGDVGDVAAIVEDVVARGNVAAWVCVVPVNLDAHTVVARSGVEGEMNGRGGRNGFCYGVAFVVVAQIIGVANQVGACLVGSLVETELLVVSEVHVNVGVHPIASVVGLNCDCIARVNGEGLVGQVLVCLLRAIELDGLDFVIARLQRDAVEHATAVVLIGFLVEIDGVFLRKSTPFFLKNEK